MRIDIHPILQFDREREISFLYNGNKIKAFEGETIASALHAAGVKDSCEHQTRGNRGMQGGGNGGR